MERLVINQLAVLQTLATPFFISQCFDIFTYAYLQCNKVSWYLITEYIICWNITSQTCALSFIWPTHNKTECANLSKKFLIVLPYTRHFVCRWLCTRTFKILLPVLIPTVWEPRRPVWVGVRHQTITASPRESVNLHVFSTIFYFMKW